MFSKSKTASSRVKHERDLDLRNRSLIFTFGSSKDDPQSFKETLQEGSLSLRDEHRPILNSMLAKRGLAIELEELQLKDKPNIVVNIDHLGKSTNFNLKSFQPIDFSVMVKRVSEDGYSKSLDTLLHRKLVWPNLGQKITRQLQTQHNDLVFSETAGSRTVEDQNLISRTFRAIFPFGSFLDLSQNPNR